MCQSCLQRYRAGNQGSSVESRTALKEFYKNRRAQVINKASVEVGEVTKLPSEVKEALAKKRRHGYVIPSARIRENSKVNDDG